MYIKETITAISTPQGEGGIGIVRVSGSLSEKIGRLLFRFENGHSFISHHLHYGKIVDPETDVIVDEAMAVLMKAPRSYTCEDVLEFQCHGGFFVLEQVLTLVLKAGARLADSGEFTRRAFLNGRIDLLKAEAVMDIISSRSKASLDFAVRQQQGALSKRIIEVRELLQYATAMVEAYIDFPEDDIGTADIYTIQKRIESANFIISDLINSFDEGRIVRDGIAVLIVGKPNVGKSSLLNSLLGEERAIVTHIAGTTRDIIEETTNIDGLAVRLLDTAGIRSTDDIVEKHGIGRTMDCIPLADLVLFVLDSSRPFDGEDREILDILKDKKVIFVANKSDLVDSLSFPSNLSEFPLYFVSTKTKSGIEQLKQTIRSTFIRESTLDSREFVAISRVRHRDALMAASDILKRSIKQIDIGVELEILSIDLREALSVIGTVTGETTTDDLLDTIFSSFCIGK